ncbi:hypothetical protein GPAL_1217 [Glaciecola pallidula DSM 14239 = ACAM 615]|uniref:Uncharacterized protein n=1 Tax=Brumicola pallidula DSM 14239 = ACAM 615 TaxID=1121922 RepID=K6ZXP6_9ALTE|nr:hypothetical protein GPAL_1217 [Glaciecola pallidula DSM 14239 = ACAM 615]
MYFKPALATTKVTLAATSYIRFASKIEGQQSINIANLQSGRMHKLHITEGIQVKQRQAGQHFHRPSAPALSRTFP